MSDLVLLKQFAASLQAQPSAKDAERGTFFSDGIIVLDTHVLGRRAVGGVESAMALREIRDDRARVLDEDHSDTLAAQAEIDSLPVTDMRDGARRSVTVESGAVHEHHLGRRSGITNVAALHG